MPAARASGGTQSKVLAALKEIAGQDGVTKAAWRAACPDVSERSFYKVANVLEEQGTSQRSERILGREPRDEHCPTVEGSLMSRVFALLCVRTIGLRSRVTYSAGSTRSGVARPTCRYTSPPVRLACARAFERASAQGWSGLRTATRDTTRHMTRHRSSGCVEPLSSCRIRMSCSSLYGMAASMTEPLAKRVFISTDPHCQTASD